MTSSPGPTPRMRRFNSSAAVAEFKHTTFWLYLAIASLVVQSISVFPVSIYAASRHSSIFVRGPVVIHPDRSASATSAISSSVISGGLKRIVLFSIMLPRFPFTNHFFYLIHTVWSQHAFIAVALFVFENPSRCVYKCYYIILVSYSIAALNKIFVNCQLNQLYLSYP